MSVLAYHTLGHTLYVSAGISCSSRHTVCLLAIYSSTHMYVRLALVCMSVLAGSTLYVSAGISCSSSTLYVSAGISYSSTHTVCQCWHIML